jgi:hypothetical protein
MTTWVGYIYIRERFFQLPDDVAWRLGGESLRRLNAVGVPIEDI